MLILLQLICIVPRFPFMKQFLASLCLIIVGTLSVSVVSPGIHSYVFHGDAECPHSKAGKSCSSHQENSTEDKQSTGSCAVVLFGQSVEHVSAFFYSGPFSLLAEGVVCFDTVGVRVLGEQNIYRVRGPPEEV